MRYLAYGSNLHPLRLLRRDIEPRLLGVVVLPGRALQFHKLSRDGSGKGTLCECDGAQVFGAVYEILPDEKSKLDRIEGLGNGYDETRLEVALQGEVCEVISYIASATHLKPSLRPYHWYKSLVLLGCEYHRFPSAYLAAIEAVASVPDPNPERRRSNESLVAEIRGA